MKRTINFTESDLQRIVKQVISEAINEHEMGLVGAYAGAQENLRTKIRLGNKRTIRPNGNVRKNKSHLDDSKINLKKMIQEEFIKIFGEHGVDLDCMCWYYKSTAYDFTFHMKSIEQINTQNFSILGDITNVDDSNLAPSLKKAIVPNVLTNVILVYNLANRTISFTNKKSGLTIKPYDNETDGWSKLLSLIGKFNAGFMKFAR